MSKFVKNNGNPNAMMGVPKMYKCCPGDYAVVCCDELGSGPKPILPCAWQLFYELLVDGNLFTEGFINYTNTFVDLATYDANWGGINAALSLGSVYELRFTLISISQDITVNSLSAINILSPAYTPLLPVTVPEITSEIMMDFSELDLTKTSFQFMIETGCGSMEVFSEFSAL